MNLSNAVAALFLLLSLSDVVDAQHSGLSHGDLSKVYRARLRQIAGSGVAGTAVVMAISPTMLVFTAGANGLPGNLNAGNCVGAAACGAHIHSGTSCDDIGGYYVGNLTNSWTNPWLEVRLKYQTGPAGTAFAGGVVETGKTDTLEGRPFMLHDTTGTPVSCGILELVTTSFANIKRVSTETSPLGGSNIDGEVTMVMPNNSTTGELCIFGKGANMEPNIMAHQHFGGDNCTATNGCGLHIHTGYSCENETTQGGHFYSSKLTSDPWMSVGYSVTSSGGDTWFAQCVNTGIYNWTEFIGKPFIFHSENGTRVACGLLEADEALNNSGGMTSAHMTLAISLVLGVIVNVAVSLF